MKNSSDEKGEVLFIGGDVVNIPKGHVIFFFAEISEKDGFLVIYGLPNCNLADAKVVIGRNGEESKNIEVNYGHWLGTGVSGIIEVQYEDKLVSISFYEGGGTYNRIPFKKVFYKK
ncbi:MAG TPA: hypothetical protein DDY52_02520 [Candidatus Moranbacteria bacterium]|nr:hypothetical protein [Candidatus Moranbacteria bacterium]